MFVTDEIDMTADNIDVLIVSSNKGLALAPGMSMLALSPRALCRVVEQPRSYYLDVRAMLTDGLRGQTPFTPAIGIFLQLDARLSKLSKESFASERAHAQALANRFREGITTLPLRPYSRYMPNAITAVEIVDHVVSARTIVKLLEEVHGLMVGPNSGELAETVFRVSHMGHQALSDVDRLIAALKQVFDMVGKR